MAAPAKESSTTMEGCSFFHLLSHMLRGMLSPGAVKYDLIFWEIFSETSLLLDVGLNPCWAILTFFIFYFLKYVDFGFLLTF